VRAPSPVDLITRRTKVARRAWPFFQLPGVTWLTMPKHEEMAFTTLVYGNEVAISTRYSCAALFAVIPPYEVRKQVGIGSEAEAGKMGG
jgi:hypothetical protein